MLNLSFANTIPPSDDKQTGVRYYCSQYWALIKKWALIDLCLSDKTKLIGEGELILPNPNVDMRDPTVKDGSRYRSYQQRAVWYGVTRRTLRGLIGEVFATDPTVEGVTGKIEGMILDVDGGGVTLDQQARTILGLTIAFGRAGLYTDYPISDTAQSHADEIAGKLQPVIHKIEPHNIINWRTKQIGSKRMLTLIVIMESYIKQDDGFKITFAPQWRQLSLIEPSPGNCVYAVQLWRLDDRGQPAPYGEQIIPTKANQKAFEEIPFTFVGPETNEPEPNEAPMYDMAELNIAHFRNSADYEESLFFCGQVTPVFSGFTQEFIDSNKDWKEGNIVLGSRAAVLLPADGTAQMLQAESNSMPMEGMKHKEEQMVSLGAKLVEQASTTKTATQDVRESSQDSSVLASCAVNVSVAFTRCLKWAADFAGVDTTPIEYKLSTSFTTSKMNAAERLQLMKEWQGGALTWEEYRYLLHRDGIAYEKDDAAKADIKKDQESDLNMIAAHQPVNDPGNLSTGKDGGAAP